jgi:hypothetical protein
VPTGALAGAEAFDSVGLASVGLGAAPAGRRRMTVTASTSDSPSWNTLTWHRHGNANGVTLATPATSLDTFGNALSLHLNGAKAMTLLKTTCSEN